jgi:hypothetical protein
METRVSRRFDNGFVLTEQELRRIIDVMIEQQSRAHGMSPHELRFTMCFRDGTISKTNAIESVIGLENYGTQRLVGLAIELCSKPLEERDTSTEIILQFSTDETAHSGFNNETGDAKVPIQLRVRGNERDWVSVTLSKIEERISKIKHVDFQGIVRRSEVRFYLMLLSGILVNVGMFILMRTSITASNERRAAVLEIERRYNAGEIADTGYLQILLHKASTELNPMNEPTTNVIFIGAMFVIVSLNPLARLLGAMLGAMFPPRVFCWGDYEPEYRKKITTSKAVWSFIFISIFAAILVGLFTEYIASTLGI